MDEDTALLSHLQWARILVKYDGRIMPGSLQVDVGSFSFVISLWGEAPLRVSMDASSNNCSGRCGQEDREDVEGGPCACERVGEERQPMRPTSGTMLQNFGNVSQKGGEAALSWSKATGVGEEQEQREWSTTGVVGPRAVGCMGGLENKPLSLGDQRGLLRPKALLGLL